MKPSDLHHHLQHHQLSSSAPPSPLPLRSPSFIFYLPRPCPPSHPKVAAKAKTVEEMNAEHERINKHREELAQQAKEKEDEEFKHQPGPSLLFALKWQSFFFNLQFCNREFFIFYTNFVCL